MGFLRHLRSKSRVKSQDDYDHHHHDHHHHPQRDDYHPKHYPPPPAVRSCGRDLTSRLDDRVLQQIFEAVCPHSLDRTCESSEESAVGDGCMLCDMRDLARSAQVDRRWYKNAKSLLYHSVRIDAVHYCEREAILSEKRHQQRRSFRKPSVNGTAVQDVPTARLNMFCRTVRESPRLAEQVEYLKLPYMTRETCKGELAATVSVLPNLKYVDLPEGAFNGDSACVTLVNELQVRCPSIRKMSYRHGAEAYLETLTRRHWQNLEELDLAGVSVEPGMLRVILASLPCLRKLTLSDLPWLADTIFQASPNLPAFPPLQSLTIQDCPRITSQGLSLFLETTVNRNTLNSLSLRNTGVTVPSLSSFLFDASQLRTFAIYAAVTFTDTLPLDAAKHLSSISLHTLHYEITSCEPSAHPSTSPAATFYSYLSRSLHANALPALRTLHVRDPLFTNLLLLPLPPTSSQLATQLDIYAKGLDEQDPIVTHISPKIAQHMTSNSDPGSPRAADFAGLHSSGGRPLSAYNASRGLGPQWGSHDSTVVGNGFGGFLAVPRDDAPRPKSAGNDRATLLGPAFGQQGWNGGASPKGSFSLSPNGSQGSTSGGESRPGSRWASPLLGGANGHGYENPTHHFDGSPAGGFKGVGSPGNTGFANGNGHRGGFGGFVDKFGGRGGMTGAKDRRKYNLWR